MGSMWKPEYEGKYFLKDVINEFGQPQTIKVDKVELTEYYQQIIREVEIKVAREFTRDLNAEYPTVWDEGWQLPSYAWVCDRCYSYYFIKQRILKEEYGIDYLTFHDLNH